MSTLTLTDAELTFLREHLEASPEYVDTTIEHYAYSLPQNAVPFTDGVPAMRRAVSASGSHFFDAETLRHWNSRILPTMIGGRFFITSERAYGIGRVYSVRWVYQAPSTDMLQVGRLEERHATSGAARKLAQLAHATLSWPTD